MSIKSMLSNTIFATYAGWPEFDPGQQQDGDFSSHLHVQIDSGAHSASCKMIAGLSWENCSEHGLAYSSYCRFRICGWIIVSTSLMGFYA